jgi:hypothetical protein
MPLAATAKRAVNGNSASNDAMVNGQSGRQPLAESETDTD